MTSKLRRYLSVTLALLMIVSPLSASYAETAEDQPEPVQVQTEVAPEPEPVVTAVPATAVPVTAPPATEVPVTEAPATEVPATEVPAEGESTPEPQGEATPEPEGEFTPETPGGATPEPQGEATPVPEFTPEPTPVPTATPVPVYAVSLDVSRVANPIYVPFGTPESALPLPGTLPAAFSDGHVADVSVLWYCTGSTVGTNYIPDCENRDVVFYFQATPVGIVCDPNMLLPAVAVMYEPEPEPMIVDHEGISFQGTDMLISSGATVTTDDILNETGYDAGYRIVSEGTIAAGESGRAIPNPIHLTGAITGGTFNGKVEMAGGAINGGTFNGRVECASGTIRGGAFNGPIGSLNGKILVHIDGGEFRGDIGDNEYDGYVFIEGGTFYCNIKARNLTVGDAHGEPVFYNKEGKGGERKTVTLGTVGVIAAGTFYADVLNRNNIIGGSFYGKVTNGGTKRNCNVLGGTFYGEFDNAVGGLVANPGESSYGGASFPGASAVNNDGVLDGGAKVRYSSDAVITNAAGGTIKSGNYPCKVINYGTIAGGNFSAGVVNMGEICGGDYTGELYNEGGTVIGANLNCKLMSNTGLIKVSGMDVDEGSKTITIARGMEFSISAILMQVGGDATGYIIKNEGTITGGDGETLPCNFNENSTGNLRGGTYTGEVYAETIESGAFTGEVHAKRIVSGTFDGRVFVAGNIENGTFNEDSVVTAYFIKGGNFAGTITGHDGADEIGLRALVTIEGGTFTGGVATLRDDGIVIRGGTFNCPVGYCADPVNDASYDGYVIIRKGDGAEPTFNGEYVGGHNVVIECGTFSEGTKVVMRSSGTIVGGTFYGPVICHNAITGGTFRGDVTMGAKPNGQIHGGTFYGHVHNKEGAYISTDGYEGHEPPHFLGGEIENEGVINPGDAVEFGPSVTIVNRESGDIKSGVFNSPVLNYGAMSGGVYNAPVTTFRTMSASPTMFMSALMDVPADTLTIQKGATMSIDEIKAMEGYDASTRIINRGTITGGSGDSLPNTITLIASYESGEGEARKSVKNGVIESGTFTGDIQSFYGMITGGTFYGKIVPAAINAAEYDETLRGNNPGETLVITIAGGTFNGSVGRKGDGHVFVIGDPVFEGSVAARNLTIESGTFNGPVELSTVGVIAGGTFNAPVVCNNNILGGTFNKEVTIASAPNGQILGGEFHGTVHNKDNAIIYHDGYESGDSQYGPPQFLEGEVDNASVMDPGEETVFAEKVTVVNQKNGTIKSGVYRGPVRNYGVISNAVLYGDVENEGEIINSIVLGKISGNGLITVEGVALNENGIIVVEEGATVQAADIKNLLNGKTESEMIVINKGTITDSGSTTLACTIIGGANPDGTGGVIAGGNYTGTVYAKTIRGGTFSGPVHNLCRETFAEMPEAAKRATEHEAAFNLDLNKNVNNSAVLYGLTINGGTFTGRIGNDGMDEAIIIKGGNFSNCKGIKAYNLTVSNSPRFGESCAVEFVVGNINGGTFAGEVLNRNNVTGGTFTGKMVNYGTIFGGSFSGGIENRGTINGGATYTDYTEDWTFDREKNQWQHNGDPVEKQVAESDVTIDCTLTNYPGGVVVGTIVTGDAYKLDDQGGKFETSALIGTPKGESKIYTGGQVLCGAPVMRTLAAIDEAEHLTSEWAYLDGTPIQADATISSNPAENAFLRTITWNVQNGELQLGMNWDEETAVPDADYSSVRILPGTTVSGGEWNVPVINEGNITGGTFNKALTNKGSVSGATINGAITAEAGTIEKCTFGAKASVVRVAEGASIQVSITANGNACVAAYGAKALDVLNAIKKQSGYEWRTVGGEEKAVEETDTITLAGGTYELKKRAVPEIIWPTASPIGVDTPLSASVLTSTDPNGTFRWKYPNTTEKAPGTKQRAVIFTPNPDNPYNYEGIETTMLIPVQIRNDIITIALNSGTHYKYYSGEEPTNLSAEVTGCRSATDKNKLKYSFVREPGEDVGTYALTVEVTQVPANYTVNIIPGTFEIRPKDINSFISVTMPNVTYTGEELSPVPTVVNLLYHETKLVYGEDFTVTFDRPVLESGKYNFTVKGIGNYTGSRSGTLTVGPGRAEVTIQSCTKTYGDPDPKFTSTCTGVSEKVGLEYELYRMEGENTGTYSIMARKLAGDNVEITQKCGILTILPKQLPNQVTAPAAQTYTGYAIQAKPVVKDGSKTLVEGTDYTLSYQNNVNAGTATVIVTGKGNYTGTQSATFTIEPADAKISVDSTVKSLGTADPKFTATVTGTVRGQSLNYSFKRSAGETVGDYAITAVPGNNPNYDVTTTPGVLEIVPDPSAVEITPAALTLDEGKSGQLSYKLIPDGTVSTVTYTSDNTAVATVAADGTVRTIKPGVATITVRTANNKTATCKLTVAPIPQAVTIGHGAKLTLTPPDKSVTNYSFASSNAAAATVDAKGAVTTKAAGNTTITASANGVELAKWNLTVIAAPNKATISATSMTLGVGEKRTLIAGNDTNAPSTYSWSTSNKKIATVDANGLVTAKKAGSAKITVKTYNGKSITCKVTVSKAPTSIKLNATSVTLGCGDKYAISVTLSKKSASAITYTSTNDAIARVEGGKIVAGNTTGTATITAQTFNGKNATCKVTVLPAPTQISLGADLTLGQGQAATLMPTLNSGSKSTITYASSDAKTVSVTAAGKVTGVKAGGSATITATTHNGVQASIVVTVKNAPSKVTLSAGKASIGVGQTYTLTATLSEGSVSPITWSSSKSSVATVNANGVVTAKKAGKATITAKAFNGKKATCTITVTKAPTSVSLSAKSATLGAGDSLTLKATPSKGSSGAITWSSNNAGVATVEDGKITAKAVGSATITATTYNGKSASCSVTVAKAPNSVSLGSNLTLGKGQSVTLQPAIDSGTVATFTYSTSNAKVVALSGAKATAKAPGTATITVKTHNGKQASCTITVTNAPNKVTMSEKKVSVGAGQTYQLKVTLPSGTVSPITWSSNKSSVASVDGNGVVTAKKAGKATITAKTYNGKKATCTITVTKAPTSVSLSAKSLTLGKGASATLKATLSKGSTSPITWSSNNAGVVAVESGKLTAKGTGSATITATTYNGKSATCSVTVVPAPTTISLGGNQTVKVKKSVTLKPTLSSGSAATLTYKSSNTKVATVDASGKVTGKKAGTATITVTTHNGLSATCVITVKK